MATESIRVSGLIPASPRVVYDAWLDSKEHSRFTGSPATVEPRVGGKVTAWNAYIEGEITELQPGKRIVQTWRSTDFPKDAPDSRLEVIVQPHALGTEITFLHEGIPEGQGHQYEEGWLNHYVTPMRRYFGHVSARSASSPPAAPAKAPAKAPAASTSKATEKPKSAKASAAPARPSAKAKAKQAAKAPKKGAARKAKPKRPAAKAPVKKRAAAKKSKPLPAKKRGGKKTR